MNPRVRLPFNGKAPITFKFGANPEWYTRVFGYPHNGVDFGMITGTAILAGAKGVVSFSDDIPDADGCGIILEHKWGLTLYWHLSRLIAKTRDEVKEGQVIGHSGATGFVTGPHLHWGMKVTGWGEARMRYWINPLDYLYRQKPLEEEPEPVSRTYRVKWGDTLWKIADDFYGNGAFWPRIYKANKGIIKHPGLIFPFQKLLIP